MQPKVITWFKVYTGFLCILYLGLAAVSPIFFLVDPPPDEELSQTGMYVMGGMFLVVGLGLFALCLLPLLVQPKPWVWVYNLVIICLGMTSACFLPICIPLLIFWIRKETKEFYRFQ